MKQVKQINESQLRAIIAESVRKVLREVNPQWTPEKLERVYGELRKNKAWAKKLDAATSQRRSPSYFKGDHDHTPEYDAMNRERDAQEWLKNGGDMSKPIAKPMPYNGDPRPDVAAKFKAYAAQQWLKQGGIEGYRNKKAKCGNINEGDFNLGEPGSFRSGSGKDFDDYSKSIGDSYKWAGSTPVEGNMDMFSVQNGHDTDSMHFQSKKETIDWIKSHISNEEQAQNLISALKDYIRVGGGKRIRQRGI